MSRTSLHRPRRPRVVWDRPATGTRLSPYPFPPTIPHLNTHYKRCPKALRLRLRSDQSTSRPLYGRSPDKSRRPLSKGHCQVRAPLTRRIRFASSGDAPEHSVMSLPRAIAPLPDSPGLDLAGESEQSDNLRLKTNAPFRDSTVVTIGDLRSTNAGHGSTLPSLGVVEHFWWSRPHRETISRLLHILSEVRGCRRAVADVKCPLERTQRIGIGVDAFSRNRPGPSITSPRRACPPKVDHSRPRSVIHPRKGRAPAPRGVPSPPSPSPLSASPVGTTGQSPSVWAPRLGRPHPSPSLLPFRGSARNLRLARSPFPPLTSPHSRKDPPISPSPPPSSQEKSNSPAKQSKFTPESAHQSKLPLHDRPVGIIGSRI